MIKTLQIASIDQLFTHEAIGMSINVLADAIKAAFENWCQVDPIYKRSAKKLKPAALEMIHAGFDELPNYKPGTYNLWYVTNHMRFIGIAQKDKTLANELTHNFLSKYVRNELESVSNTKKSRQKPTK